MSEEVKVPSIKEDGFTEEVCERMIRVFNGAWLDIQHQLEMSEHTTGEVKEAYAKVIIDKTHKLSKLVGEMWLESCHFLSEFETKLRNPKIDADLNKDSQ
jgi:hypothetical protein